MAAEREAQVQLRTLCAVQAVRVWSLGPWAAIAWACSCTAAGTHAFAVRMSGAEACSRSLHHVWRCWDWLWPPAPCAAPGANLHRVLVQTRWLGSASLSGTAPIWAGCPYAVRPSSLPLPPPPSPSPPLSLGYGCTGDSGKSETRGRLVPRKRALTRACLYRDCLVALE
eukprot:2870854-Rhodomonas_salina.2